MYIDSASLLLALFVQMCVCVCVFSNKGDTWGETGGAGYWPYSFHYSSSKISQLLPLNPLTAPISFSRYVFLTNRPFLHSLTADGGMIDGSLCSLVFGYQISCRALLH